MFLPSDEQGGASAGPPEGAVRDAGNQRDDPQQPHTL